MKIFDTSLGLLGSHVLGMAGTGIALLGLAALLATNPVAGELGLQHVVAMALGIVGVLLVCAAPFVRSGRSRTSSSRQLRPPRLPDKVP